MVSNILLQACTRHFHDIKTRQHLLRIGEIPDQLSDWRRRYPDQGGEGDNLVLFGSFRMLQQIHYLYIDIPRKVILTDTPEILHGQLRLGCHASDIQLELPGLTGGIVCHLHVADGFFGIIRLCYGETPADGTIFIFLFVFPAVKSRFPSLISFLYPYLPRRRAGTYLAALVPDGDYERESNTALEQDRCLVYAYTLSGGEQPIKGRYSVRSEESSMYNNDDTRKRLGRCNFKRVRNE